MGENPIKSGGSLNLVNKSIQEYEPSAQLDQSKATQEIGISEQCQESYQNCFLTERADNKTQDKATGMLVETLFLVALGIKIGSKQLSNSPENCLEEVLFPLPTLAQSAYLSSSQYSLLQAG